MALEYEYLRGTQNIAAVPPYRRAIPNYNELAASYGKSLGQQDIQSANVSLKNMTVQNDINQQRRALNIAKRQNVPATALAIGGVAASGLLTIDQFMEEKKKKLEEEAYYRRMESIISAFPDAIKRITTEIRNTPIYGGVNPNTYMDNRFSQSGLPLRFPTGEIQ